MRSPEVRWKTACRMRYIGWRWGLRGGGCRSRCYRCARNGSRWTSWSISSWKCQGFCGFIRSSDNQMLWIQIDSHSFFEISWTKLPFAFGSRVAGCWLKFSKWVNLASRALFNRGVVAADRRCGEDSRDRHRWHRRCTTNSCCFTAGSFSSADWHRFLAMSRGIWPLHSIASSTDCPYKV